MNLTKLTLVALLALSGVSAAQALNLQRDITLIGDASTGYSAGISDTSGVLVNHPVSGVFTDTFSFAYSGGALVDVWLSTSVAENRLATQQIVFTSASLNGMALDIDPVETLGGTRFTTAGLFQVPAYGSFVLTVNGFAGLQGSTGQTISASYSGGLNAMPTAVPEPETYALMLGGVAAIGFVVRRRKVK